MSGPQDRGVTRRIEWDEPDLTLRDPHADLFDEFPEERYPDPVIPALPLGWPARAWLAVVLGADALAISLVLWQIFKK